MNTVVLLVVAALVVLYFMKDSEDESYLVKLLRMAKLAPEKPEPEEKQVFDGYMDLSYDSLYTDPAKAKEYAVKAVDESLKYVKSEEELVVKPKRLTANDWLKSPAVAVGIILAALLLLSQCDMRTPKFSVPDTDTVQQLFSADNVN